MTPSPFGGYSFFNWVGINFINDISPIITSPDSDIVPEKHTLTVFLLSHCVVLCLVFESLTYVFL